jgi:hypothetical protein
VAQYAGLPLYNFSVFIPYLTSAISIIKCLLRPNMQIDEVNAKTRSLLISM